MPGQDVRDDLLSVPGPLSMTFVGWSIRLSSWFEGMLHVRFRIAYIVSERVGSPFFCTCAKESGPLPALPLQGFCIKSIGEKKPTLDT